LKKKLKQEIKGLKKGAHLTKLDPAHLKKIVKQIQKKLKH
jgi:heptaprenylglyceryl phosphate synthase